MDLERWQPWYRRIASRLKLNPELDQAATDLLSGLLSEKGLTADAVTAKLKGRNVIVAGAGPSLDGNLQSLLNSELPASWMFIAADGATSALLDNGLTPTVVVSDIDGQMDDILLAGRRGAIIVVHGHSDNCDALKAYVPKVSTPILGSTQVEPRRKVYNFGGFTDGDRCVFLCEAAAVKTVVLVGMDLGREVGCYSKELKIGGRMLKRKRMKLNIAKELLAWLATWSRCKIYNATGAGDTIPGISKLPIERLRNLNPEDALKQLV